MAALRSWLPLTREEADTLFAWIGDTVYAMLYGTLLTGILQETLGGLIFWLLGVKGPWFWAIVMGILTILPIVGPTVVWVPTAAWFALDGQWGKAIILAAWGSIVIGSFGNLLYPMFAGHRLRLHTMAIFVTMVGGLMLFGASGFFLGPVALAVVLALLEIWNGRASPAGNRTWGRTSPMAEDRIAHLRR